MRFILAAAFLFAAPAIGSETTLLCEGAGGGTAKPKLVVKAAEGHTLFLCAVSSKKKKGHLVVSGFKVFEISGKKKPKSIFKSELENINYSAAARGNDLVLDELIWNGKEKVPAFELAFSCSANGCHSAPVTCVFQKGKPGSRRAIEQIHEFQKGSKRGKIPDSKLINLLAALAYSGDADAQALFRDRGALVLDGEPGETYFDHQATIQRLKKAGCL